MRKSSVTRALAILLSMIMLLTGLPVPIYAESADMPVGTVDEQTEEIVVEDTPALTEDEQYGEIPEEPDLPTGEATETPVEDEPAVEPEAPTEDAAFPEGDTTPGDASGDDSAAGTDPAEETDGIPGDQPITEDMLEEEVPVEPLPEDEFDIPDEPVVEEAPTLFSVDNPSRFSGDEEVRLGKESSNINGIIVRKKGGSSNSIARHWVTVDGVEYTAYCIQVSKSATSGRNGGLEPSTDAGLLWILNHVPESSDQDYAIKQQAIWAYLGQSLAIKDLGAGSRCTMTTEELQQHLTDIVSSAQSATLSGNQELWIAYHLDNRNYYQDMVFSVAEPPPAATPTPTPFVPTPTPFVPTPTPFVPTPTPFVPTPTPFVPTPTPFVPTPTPFVPTPTPFVPTPTPFVPTPTPFVPTPTPFVPTPTPFIPTPTPYEPTPTPFVPTPTPYVPTPTPFVPTPTPYVPTPTPYIPDGSILVVKTDAATGSLLAGTIFELLSGNTVMATATTGADGTVVFTDVPPGTYTVRESAAPEGYLLSVKCEQSVTVISGESASILFENERISGKIRIYKTDADSQEPLAGAAFTVTDAAGSPVETLVTDSNGTAETGWLPYGTYTITETAAPEHYINSGFTTIISITEHGKTYTVEVENKSLSGGLMLRKKDALTGTPIGSVQFDIYQNGSLVATMTTDAGGVATCNGLDAGTYTVKEHALPVGYVGELVVLEATITADITTVLDATNMPSQSKIQIIKTDSVTGDKLPGAEFSIASADGRIVGQLTTGEDGTVTSGWLPYGVYIITETRAPAAYVNRGFTTTVEAYEDGKTYTIQVENEPTKGGIKVVKTDSLTQQSIAGVQFDVYQGDTLIGTMTTNDQGIAVLEAVEKGSYTVKEHALPTGYVGELAEMTAVVESEKVTELSVTNTPSRSKVRIIKTDSLTGKALPGAEFTITDTAGNVVAVLTTGEDGKTESEWLTYGSYTVTETAAPDHYLNGGFTQTLEAFEDGKTYDFSVSNAPTKGGIRLTKTDAETGEPLAGVKFNIYMGDMLVASMTTNANGVATCDNLDRGTYIVKEATLPEGYAGELVVLEAVVQSDAVTELDAVNTKSQSRIRIAKIDALTGGAVSGAEFTVTDEAGAVVAVITTDANGEAITDWLPYGMYTVAETKAPEHYLPSDWSMPVAAHEDGKTYTFEVPNTPSTGYISITKTDSLDDYPISDVVFDIYQGDQLVDSMTTDESGLALSDPLPKGMYTVKERDNPTGYVADLITLDAEVHSDKTTALIVTNTPIQGRIRIVKKDALTGEMLAGAEFTITRVSGLPSHFGAGTGEVVAVVTTGVDGTAETPLLPYGTYRVKESKVPEHFVDNHFFEDVTITENMTTCELIVENEPTKGWIQLTKTDSLDGHPIAGVQFNIYHHDEYGNDLAATMTTDENGVAVSPALRKGKYLVREADEPIGYVSDLVELKADVTPDETTYLTATNQPIQGILRILKRDELTGEALAGAEFTITRISGLPSHNGEGNGEVVAVITTDAAGVAASPLLTYGTYKVEETKVPPHFVDNNFSTEMVINEENYCTYEIDVENEPAKGWLKLTKTDRLNGNPIEGVVFDVYYSDAYGTGLATTMTTDANGIAISEPLRKGKYQVVERGTTAGYVFEEILLDATVHPDETTELSADNQPVQVKLKLYKRDADEYSGNPADAPVVRGDGVLTGAEFEVLAAEDVLDRQGNVLHPKGEVVVPSVKTEGAEASVTTEALWPGLYEVVELTPPTGYQPLKGTVLVDSRSAADQSKEAIVTYEGVVQNEIRYGAQAIMKILGQTSPDTDPTRVETPEEGAEFRVYLKKGGSYEKAREAERDSLITDENGYAMTKALPYGIYVLEQVKGKEGYEIIEPIVFEIDGTESLVNPPLLALTDQPILYRLKFIKTDAETGRTITLSHASFKLKDADGNFVKQKVFYPREQVIDTFTTDETGSVTLPEAVTWGLYSVVEVKAPEGYLIRSDDFPVFVGDEGDEPGQTYELEIEIPNEPVKGRILLDKKGLQLTGYEISTDAWGNKVHTPVYEEGYLAGAEFEVRAAEAITGQDGTVWYDRGARVDTITTTDKGGDASCLLPLGKYELVEVSAPEGYLIDSQPIAVNLYNKDDHTAVTEIRITAGNDFLPAEISLWKEKEAIHTVTSSKESIKSILTTEPGEGFVFGLFAAKDMPYAYGTLLADTLVASGATDENGMLTLKGTFPHGSYYIRELDAPDGWKLSADTIPVNISLAQKDRDENVLRILLTEPIHNELIHTKVTLTKTDLTGVNPLPGATIEVYNDEGKLIHRDVTDENGRIANIPVTPGRYTFREVYAPEGYALSDAIMTFTVSEDGIVTGDTTIRDDFSRFSVMKCDENESPLAGVEFSLIGANGATVMTVRTDREGIATFEKVPFGNYRIVETQPLAGYLPADTEVKATLDGTFINPDEPLATIVNTPNEVIVRKVDQDGKPLSGAEFGLFDAFDECFATAVSDENGMVRFHGIPYGSYTIRELNAPEGYLESRDEIPLKIDAEDHGSNKPLATVINQRKRVQFIKVDTSGKRLPGVAFSLINAATQKVVETAVSNEKGEFIFTRFDYGDWIIRENAAPEGYNRMEDYHLHVDENWKEPKPITLVNIPSTYMFFKSDNKKNAIAGATFVVEDENGHVVQEVVSAENGVVYIYGLTPGKYTIREIATVGGFTVNDDTITVEIDEKYKVPTKLKRFVNYPSIATGVDVSPTMLTWAGVGLSGLAGLILALHAVLKGNPKKHHKRK